MRVPIVATALGAVIWLAGPADQAEGAACCKLATGCVQSGLQQCRLVHMGTFMINHNCVGGVCVKKPSGGEG